MQRGSAGRSVWAPLKLYAPAGAPLAAIANTSAGNRIEVAAFRRWGAALLETGDGDGKWIMGQFDA